MNITNLLLKEVLDIISLTLFSILESLYSSALYLKEHVWVCLSKLMFFIRLVYTAALVELDMILLC